MGESLEEYLPAIAMIGVQVVSAVAALLNRASLITGMSLMVFTVYRQAIAAIVTFSICYFIRVVLYQIFYYKGLYMTSSSVGTASANLAPAITFIFTVILGMEQVNITKLSSIAKITGTILCVGGAICIALLRGPEILNVHLPPSFTNFLALESSENDKNWILGCLFLFASKSCWAIWLIMQVPISRCYPDPLALSAWMSFIGMLQAAVIAMFTDPDLEAWNLSSPMELVSCFFSGMLGSGAKFCVLAWCITKRGEPMDLIEEEADIPGEE